jgi:hypothetical protein
MRRLVAMMLLLAVPFAGSAQTPMGLPVSPELRQASDSKLPPAKPPTREQWFKGSAKALEAQWRALLPKLDPEVNAFLKRTGTKIVLTKPRPGLFTMRGQIAQYEKGFVYINAETMEAFGRELFAKAPAADAYRHLALLSLPMISHETRHGISREQIEKKLGADYPFGSVEDEIVAFGHQALVAERIERRYGKELAAYAGHTLYVENHGLVTRLRFGGISGGKGIFGGVESMIRNALQYGSHPVMKKIDREKFLARVVRPATRPGTPAAERAKALKAERFLADPGRLDGLNAYYEEAKKELHQRWSSERASKSGS